MNDLDLFHVREAIFDASVQIWYKVISVTFNISFRYENV